MDDFTRISSNTGPTFRELWTVFRTQLKFKSVLIGPTPCLVDTGRPLASVGSPCSIRMIDMFRSLSCTGLSRSVVTIILTVSGPPPSFISPLGQLAHPVLQLPRLTSDISEHFQRIPFLIWRTWWSSPADYKTRINTPPPVADASFSDTPKPFYR